MQRLSILRLRLCPLMLRAWLHRAHRQAAEAAMPPAAPLWTAHHRQMRQSALQKRIQQQWPRCGSCAVMRRRQSFWRMSSSGDVMATSRCTPENVFGCVSTSMSSSSASCAHDELMYGKQRQVKARQIILVSNGSPLKQC